MRYGFAARAWRQWQKLPNPVRTKLEGKLKVLVENPRRHAKKLTDSSIGEYRFRIRDYRIIFDIKSDEIMILAVGHRSTIYK